MSWEEKPNLIENICIGVSQMLMYESLGKPIKMSIR